MTVLKVLAVVGLTLAAIWLVVSVATVAWIAVVARHLNHHQPAPIRAEEAAR